MNFAHLLDDVLPSNIISKVSYHFFFFLVDFADKFFIHLFKFWMLDLSLSV